MAFGYTTNAAPPQYSTNDPSQQTNPWLSLLGAGAGVASALSSPYGEGSRIQNGSYGQSTLPWEQAQYQQAYGYNNAAAGRTAGQAVAGFTPDQVAAQNAIRSSQGFGMPQLLQAQNNSQALAGGVGASQIQSFMNPYQQNAINATMSDLGRQRDIGNANISSQANAANAWGGDRATVAQGLNNDSYARAMASTSANMQNQGYANAQSAAFQNQNARLAGNQQLQNTILNRINANNSQNQNLLQSGNQQQQQNQNSANWAIQQGQIAGSNLNPGVGMQGYGNGQSGTKVNPVSGTIAGLTGGLQFANTLQNAYGQLSGGFSNAQQQAAQNYFGSDYGTGGGYVPDTSVTGAGWQSDPNNPDNWGDPSSFNSAGGQAANQPYSSSTPQSTDYSAYAGASASNPLAGGNPTSGFASPNLSGSQYVPSLNAPQSGGLSFGQGLNDASNALNVYNGLQRGGVSGYGGAALSGAKLYGNVSGSSLPGVGAAGSALGIYNGIKQGGVAGYGGAALSGGTLAQQMGANFGGSTIPVAGAALADYNAIKNWQSGKTGSDTLNGVGAGAATGAAVGSIVPGIGTAIGAGVGALVGGAAGALSSAFGPGAKDPEQATFDNYAKAYAHNPASVSQATPQQTFQSLAGLFDLRKTGPNVPMYAQYGRMGEAKFTSDMAGQVNSAISSGKIPPNASPQQIYQQVINPWMTSWNKGDLSKDPHGGAIQSMVTNLIGQWQSGQLNSGTQVGVKGQTLNLPSYGAASQPAQAPAPQARTLSYARARVSGR